MVRNPFRACTRLPEVQTRFFEDPTAYIDAWSDYLETTRILRHSSCNETRNVGRREANERAEI
jgi:hypothetical protein